MEKHSLLEVQTKFRVEHLGEGVLFEDAFLKQLKALEEVSFDKSQTILITCVHKRVFTLGNSFKKELNNLPNDFVQTDRGGKVMYHGPGQLTIYPIFKLTNHFSGPKEYLKFLFDTCIEYFKKEHGVLLACRNNGLWNEDDKKVGFVGLRVKKGITYHGLSLNYFTDLNAFLEHSPCDIEGSQAGNLFNEKSHDLLEEAKGITSALLKGL